MGRGVPLGLAVLGLALLGPVAGAAPEGRDLAAELSSAQSALAAGDYARAYATYLSHADDNPLAQFTLGLFHQNGWGRPADPAEACRWEERAAQGGIPAAQQMLAECLRHGVHRPADPAGAAHWYQQAASSGIVTASCSLAELYMVGEGVPKDPGKAIDICRLAAEKASAPAQVSLARLYLEGDATVRDPAAARQWLQAAAQADSAEAQYRLGILLRDGVGGPVDPSSARWWLETAASQGWLPAYLPTAELYLSAPVEPETGRLSAKDLAKAYLWSAAAVRRLSPGPEAEQAAAVRDQVLQRMPETWRPDLDRQIADHLSKLENRGHNTD